MKALTRRTPSLQHLHVSFHSSPYRWSQWWREPKLCGSVHTSCVERAILNRRNDSRNGIVRITDDPLRDVEVVSDIRRVARDFLSERLCQVLKCFTGLKAFRIASKGLEPNFCYNRKEARRKQQERLDRLPEDCAVGNCRRWQVQHGFDSLLGERDPEARTRRTKSKAYTSRRRAAVFEMVVRISRQC